MAGRVTAKDCRKCGLCCTSPREQDVLADLSQEDADRLDPRWAAANVIAYMSAFDLMVNHIYGRRCPPGAIRTAWKRQRCGPFKGMEACVCVALRGSLMHRTSCTIYGKRPESCRTAVKPGDKTCLMIRRRWLERVEAA